MRGFRTMVGPLAFGAGVWAAAGALAPLAADASHRVAVPASPVWFVLAAIAGWLIKTFRRQPMLATPALLSVVPYLPVPLPPFALIWTGAWAWMPVGLSLVAAWLASWPAPMPVAKPGHPWRIAVLAGTVTFLLGAAVWVSLGPRKPGGDEPHYLVIAQSLLKDGDLQIENNHRSRDYAAFVDGDLPPHAIQRGKNGAQYSVHAPGLPVVVAPLFALAGYLGAQLTVLVLAAVAGAFIWWVAWETTRDRSSAWFAWAATTTSVTFLVLTIQVFPDVPGAASTAVGVAAITALARGRTLRPVLLVGVSAALSLLPFLHSRLVVIAVVLGVAILSQLLTLPDVSGAARWRRAVMFAAVPTVASAAWFGYFLAIYGTPNPSAPYGTAPEIRLAYIPGGIVGLLVDQQFGVLTYAPVLAAAALGRIGRATSELRLASRACWFALVAYVASASTYWMWWAGVPATPARFLAAALPLVSIPLAAAWHAGDAFRRSLLIVLMASSAAMSALILLVGSGALAWNIRGNEASWIAELGSAANLSRVWPSFFWRLTPGEVSSEVFFFRHALGWVGVFTALAWGLGAWVRGRQDVERTRAGALAAAWWPPLGLAILSLMAPWLAGGPRLQPGTAQLRVLSRTAHGASAIELRPFAARRVTSSLPTLRIAVTGADAIEAGLDPGSALLRSVPAGRYEVVVRARRPLGGELTIRGAGADQRWQLTPTSEQRMAWTAAEDAAEVVFTFDPVLVKSRPVIELVPLSLVPRVQ